MHTAVRLCRGSVRVVRRGPGRCTGSPGATWNSNPAHRRGQIERTTERSPDRPLIEPRPARSAGSDQYQFFATECAHAPHGVA